MTKFVLDVVSQIDKKNNDFKNNNS